MANSPDPCVLLDAFETRNASGFRMRCGVVHLISKLISVISAEMLGGRLEKSAIQLIQHALKALSVSLTRRKVRISVVRGINQNVSFFISSDKRLSINQSI